MSSEEGSRPKKYFELLFIWSLVSTVEHEVILHHVGNNSNDAQNDVQFYKKCRTARTVKLRFQIHNFLS